MTLLPSKWCERCDEYHPDHQHIPRWSVEPLPGSTGTTRPVHAHTAGQAAERWAALEIRESVEAWQPVLGGDGANVKVTNLETGDSRLYRVAGQLVPRFVATAVVDVQPFASLDERAS